MHKYISLVDKAENENFEFRDESKEHLFVGPISQINILIGANNARKSRFMRMLVKQDITPTSNQTIKLAFEKGIDAFNHLIEELGNDEIFNVKQFNAPPLNPPKWINAFTYPPNRKSLEEKGDLFNKTIGKRNDRWVLDQEEFKTLKKRLVQLFCQRADVLTVGSETLQNHQDLFDLLYQSQHLNDQTKADPDKIAFNLISKLTDDFLDIKHAFRELIKECPITNSDKIFIPALRGSLPLYENINAETVDFIGIYEYTAHCLYFNGKGNTPANRKFSISAGDRMHQVILTDRNSTFEKRERFQQFQTFVSCHFFKGKRIEIVAEPNTKSRGIRIYIADEAERNLQDLGDGIQHLLILLYPIFMAEESAWIFIDEPELSLHPGFQNLFLDTLLNNEDLKKKNLRYFMTTHSNHFLSHALRTPKDVSVFSFSQHNANQSIIRRVHGADPTVLDQLGVENASVYMANSSIWVEGISDRRYIQAFLKSYCKATGKPEFKEGLDFTFFEYAGTNLKHYLFEPDKDDPDLIDSFKNANRIFLLSDQDEGKDDKHTTLAALKSNNFEYHTTGTREIENLLPPDIFQDFIQERKGQSQNTFSAELKDYAKEQMGTFLKQNSGNNPPEYGNGTLTTDYKNKLSQLVLENKYEWNTFSVSPELKRITEAVYDFIKKHNSRD